MNNLNNYKFFQKNGYVVINLLSKSDLDNTINTICNKFNRIITKKHKKLFFNKKNIKNYHKLPYVTKYHEKFMNNSKRYILLDKQILQKLPKNKVIQEIITNYWGHKKFVPKWVGSISEVKDFAAGFRIARPSKLNYRDDAGSHSDIHVGGKIANDHKILITAWVPLIGHSEKYSLRFAPGSHLFNHPHKSHTKQKKHMSKALGSNYLKKFKFKRLNFKKGQALFFHPNLIHGDSTNKGSFTRLSFEIRLFNKKNALKFTNKLKSN